MSPRPAPPPDLAGRWLSKFFTSHLAGERAASPKTVSSYRDAMKLLLTWFRDAERIPPEKLRLADIDRPRVLRFPDWLEAGRGCSPATRNQRLAVIKSFCRYTAAGQPGQLGQVTHHRGRHPGVGADADPLFTGPNHSRLTRSGVAKLLARHVRAVRARDPGWAPGLPVTPHTLRRSRAMHLVQAGVNLIYIRDLLGHADVSTTEIYARADAEAKRRAIENAYEPLTPDALPDWTSDSSLLGWLDSLGR